MVSQSTAYDRETSDTPESIQDPADTAKSPRRDPSNIPQVVTDGLPLIRENLIQKELSDAAQNIIMVHGAKVRQNNTDHIYLVGQTFVKDSKFPLIVLAQQKLSNF